MRQPTTQLTTAMVLDSRIHALAAALKPAQESMHASWRGSGLYYNHIDSLVEQVGNDAVGFITAAKLAGLVIHAGRALDAVRGSTDLDKAATNEVVHNLVDMLLGILDTAEHLGADLGDQMLKQLAVAMERYSAGGRQEKLF